MARHSVPEADAILDQRFPILDHGWVALVDYQGSDARIAEAARCSYQDGTKRISDDRALIDYLTRHRHTSPLEMVEFTFAIKLPIFVMRQLVRHRTASLNEVSGRYSVIPEEFYIPQREEVQSQSSTNKQGRGGELDDPIRREFINDLIGMDNVAYAAYKSYLESGVARELARTLLPVNVYTQCYWKIDWRNLSHFLGLRKDGHAQSEMRAYADRIGDLAKRVVPDAYASWEEHVFHARTFSRTEMDILRRMIEDREQLAWATEEFGLSASRKREFLAKLEGAAE